MLNSKVLPLLKTPNTKSQIPDLSIAENTMAVYFAAERSSIAVEIQDQIFRF